MTKRHVEAKAWHRTQDQIAEDRETFATRVLPVIEGMELSSLARATGLSKAQCSLVRRELRTLHPRHWAGVLGKAGVAAVRVP